MVMCNARVVKIPNANNKAFLLVSVLPKKGIPQYTNTELGIVTTATHRHFAAKKNGPHAAACCERQGRCILQHIIQLTPPSGKPASLDVLRQTIIRRQQQLQQQITTSAPLAPSAMRGIPTFDAIVRHAEDQLQRLDRGASAPNSHCDLSQAQI